MKPVLELLQLPLAHRLGWVLLHSLWQGALVAVGFGLIRLSLRRHSSRARYVAGCVSLLLFATAPVVTFLLLGSARQPALENGGQAVVAGTAPIIIATDGVGSARIGNFTRPLLSRCAEFLDGTIPALVAAWALGVALFSIRLAQGCWRLKSLRNEGLEPLDSGWIELLNDLKQRLNISRPVKLFKSALVEVPTVVGWFRPVILLPASSLTGLTPSQLESILAHELAHIVRHDYLVNLFQNVAETLMFYHPAVWWISRCIREEREHCCDDLAVRLCGDRVVYASALATLEELRSETPELALAAGGGSLLGRIRRLAGLSAEPGSPGSRSAGGLALAGVGLVLAVFGVCLLLAPARYQATARIRIQRESQDTGLEVDKNKSNNDEPYYLPTEMETIRSPIILGRVVEILHLNESWGRKFNGGVAFKTSEAVNLLKHSTEVNSVRNSSVVEIRVLSDTAIDAADLANTIAEAYKAHRLTQSFEMMSNGIVALRREWDEQEERVRAAQTNVERLRKELSISDADAESLRPAPTLSVSAWHELQAQLINLEASRLSQETALQRITNLPPSKLREAVQVLLDQPDRQLPELVSQLDLAEANLITAAKDYSSDHPLYLAAKKRVDQLSSKIDARVEGILIGMQTRLDKTKATIAVLKESLESARTNDQALAERSRPYYAANRKLQDLIEFKKALGTRIASMKLDLSLPRHASVEILERASPPHDSVSSNQTLGVALVISGGVLGFSGIVLLVRKREATSV